jgi:hypothetical protein
MLILNNPYWRSAMLNFDDEKEKLTRELSEQYAQNVITMEEYERLLEYINKIETKKEVSIVERIIQENSVSTSEPTTTKNSEIVIPKNTKRHLSLFSWRTSNVISINGYGGKYTSIFGANRIIVDNLPKGRTVLNVKSVFGLTEIIVSKNVKITNKLAPIFAGVFAPNEINREDEELPELYLVGQAVFGNITIQRSDEFEKRMEEVNEFNKKLTEKIYKKMLS